MNRNFTTKKSGTLSHSSKRLLGRIRRLANYPGFIVGVSCQGGYETYVVEWEENIDDLIAMLENGEKEDRDLACAWIGHKLGFEVAPPRKITSTMGDTSQVAWFKPNIKT